MYKGARNDLISDYSYFIFKEEVRIFSVDIEELCHFIQLFVFSFSILAVLLPINALLFSH